MARFAVLLVGAKFVVFLPFPIPPRAKTTCMRPNFSTTWRTTMLCIIDRLSCNGNNSRMTKTFRSIFWHCTTLQVYITESTDKGYHFITLSVNKQWKVAGVNVQTSSYLNRLKIHKGIHKGSRATSTVHSKKVMIFHATWLSWSFLMVEGGGPIIESEKKILFPTLWLKSNFELNIAYRVLRGSLHAPVPLFKYASSNILIHKTTFTLK